MDILGRAAFVTGGASGIGRATVVALAERGASVVFIDRDEEGARQTIARAGQPDRVVFRACDVTDGKDLAAAVGSTSSRTSLVSATVICSLTIRGPGGGSSTST